MRDLLGEDAAVFGEIPSQAQDDEPLIGIFRDDRTKDLIRNKYRGGKSTADSL